MTSDFGVFIGITIHSQTLTVNGNLNIFVDYKSWWQRDV